MEIYEKHHFTFNIKCLVFLCFYSEYTGYAFDFLEEIVLNYGSARCFER